MHTSDVDVIDLEGVIELDRDSRTVYVTSVSGEKMYELRDKPFFVKALSGVQLFQMIRIEGNRLTLASKNVQGELMDFFVIEKEF